MTPTAAFRFDAAAAVADWMAIDDAVMGGVSQSHPHLDPAGHAIFEGEVPLQHGGGFASVRSALRSLGLPHAHACVIEVRGDDKRYKLNLRTDDTFDGVNYQVAFAPAAGTWTRIRLPLATFAPTFRGRSVDAAAALDPARLRQIDQSELPAVEKARLTALLADSLLRAIGVDVLDKRLQAMHAVLAGRQEPSRP